MFLRCHLNKVRLAVLSPFIIKAGSRANKQEKNKVCCMRSQTLNGLILISTYFDNQNKITLQKSYLLIINVINVYIIF